MKTTYSFIHRRSSTSTQRSAAKFLAGDVVRIRSGVRFEGALCTIERIENIHATVVVLGIGEVRIPLVDLTFVRRPGTSTTSAHFAFLLGQGR